MANDNTTSETFYQVSTSSSFTSLNTNALVSFHRAAPVAEQSNVDLFILTENSTFNELPRIVIGRRKFVKEDLLHKKRRRTSWIRKHGTYLLEINESGEKEKAFWSCDRCDTRRLFTLYAAEATSNAISHLRSEHRLHELSEDQEKDRSSKRHSTSVLDMQRRSITYDPIVKSRADSFKAVLLRWMVDANVSLTAVESKLFRKLLGIASPDVDGLLPHSGDTIRNWLMKEFETTSEELKAEIKKSLSQIHLSFDLWTSPNQLAIMAVVTHYLDQSYTVKTRLISMRRLQGSHSGENMAQLFIQLATDYELTWERVGFFNIDNAESNDTCLHTFLHYLNPEITARQIKQRRLRCWGHILNLTAKALLFGKNADAFEVELDTNTVLGREREALELWRRHGPIGKLHNIVVFVRRTPQRRELFIKISNLEEEDSTFMLNHDTKNLQVLQDNDTR